MAMNLKNLSGKRFGLLTVLSLADRAQWRSKHAAWVCQCDCGKSTIAESSCLICGQTKSCGCLRGDRQRRHGHAKRHGKRSLEYNTWKGMRERCRDKNHPSFKYYGGRGISVCSRWNSFASFLEDMGPRPSSKHSIDRIDNNGNYEPSNCRWATRQEQNENSRNCRLIKFRGETAPVSVLARRYGFNPEQIRKRIRRGLSADQALTTPSRYAPTAGRSR